MDWGLRPRRFMTFISDAPACLLTDFDRSLKTLPRYYPVIVRGRGCLRRIPLADIRAERLQLADDVIGKNALGVWISIRLLSALSESCLIPL